MRVWVYACEQERACEWEGVCDFEYMRVNQGYDGICCDIYISREDHSHLSYKTIPYAASSLAIYNITTYIMHIVHPM